MIQEQNGPEMDSSIPVEAYTLTHPEFDFYFGFLVFAGGNMARFHRLAAEKASLDKHQRSAWLNQPC